MTSTTDRPVKPWPTRREREGGPARPVTARTRSPRPADPIGHLDLSVSAEPTPAVERAAGWPAVPERPAAVVEQTAAAVEQPAAYVPRHAAADTSGEAPAATVHAGDVRAAYLQATDLHLTDAEVTEQLPIVIPAQRSAGIDPAPASPADSGSRTASPGEAVAVNASPGEAGSPERPRPEAPRPAPRPRPVSAQVLVPGPGPATVTPVPGPATIPPDADQLPAAASTPTPAAVVVEPATTPRPAPWRPTSTPRPPRPAVGSAVHDVAPDIRPMRDGLGVAAVCLGALGLPLGLAPVSGFVAAGLGVLALAFGIAGWSRVRSRTASNRGTAVTGAVLGLIALGLGVAGTIAFVRAPDRLVYDVDSLTAGSTTAIAVTHSGE